MILEGSIKGKFLEQLLVLCILNIYILYCSCLNKCYFKLSRSYNCQLLCITTSYISSSPRNVHSVMTVQVCIWSNRVETREAIVPKDMLKAEWKYIRCFPTTTGMFPRYITSRKISAPPLDIICIESIGEKSLSPTFEGDSGGRECFDV